MRVRKTLDQRSLPRRPWLLYMPWLPWLALPGLCACAPQFNQFPQLMASGQLYEATCVVRNERDRNHRAAVEPPYLKAANARVARVLAARLQAKLRVTAVTQAELESRHGAFGATVAAKAVVVRVDFRYHAVPGFGAELYDVHYFSPERTEPQSWLFFGDKPTAAALSELSGEQIPGSTVSTQGPGALERAADAASRSPLGVMTKTMSRLTLGIVPDPLHRAHPLPETRTFVYGPTNSEIASAAPLATRLHDEFLNDTEPNRGAPVQQLRRVVIMRRPADELNAPLEIVFGMALQALGRDEDPLCAAPVGFRLRLADPLPLSQRLDAVFQGQFQPLETFF